MLKSYKTFIARGEDEFIINKSRFIGAGAPCASEDEALAFLAARRARYKDASHNCYAYIIGANMGVMRYSDDGEPGGTAGMPIIEALKAREVTNCCLVVTRYFGGVLLGAGGLTRAYARGASVAMSACGVGGMHPTATYMADVPYATLGRAEYALASEPVKVLDKRFAEVVTLTLAVKCEDEARLCALMDDMRLEYARFDEEYMAWREE